MKINWKEVCDQLAHITAGGAVTVAVCIIGAEIGPLAGGLIGFSIGLARKFTGWQDNNGGSRNLIQFALDRHNGLIATITIIDLCSWTIGGALGTLK